MMRRPLFLSGLLLAAALASAPAGAESRQVTLSVPGMFCAACPLVVRQALTSVPGVERVEVALETRSATVDYDDDRATLEHLLAASRDAGYPAEVKPR